MLRYIELTTRPRFSYHYLFSVSIQCDIVHIGLWWYIYVSVPYIFILSLQFVSLKNKKPLHKASP